MHRIPIVVRTVCLTGLLALSLAAQAADIEGQHFDDRIRLADSELVLNGVGLRAVAWFKGYAAGLYLGQKASTAEAALAELDALFASLQHRAFSGTL